MPLCRPEIRLLRVSEVRQGKRGNTRDGRALSSCGDEVVGTAGAERQGQEWKMQKGVKKGDCGGYVQDMEAERFVEG